MTLTLDLLPARHGDSLWLAYGPAHDRHHVLVDGGPGGTVLRRALLELVQATPRLDLLVVTHIDADHIAGVLDLLDQEVPLRAGDVWFNGWEHLPTDLLGAKQGERLSRSIVQRRLPWNAAFQGRAVVVPDTGPLPVVEVAGGLRLTLLSPTRAALAELRPVWRKEVIRAGLVPGAAAEEARAALPDLLGGEGPFDPEQLAATPFVADPSEANGASIAFLAEHEGSSLLLTGDAHAGILTAGLRRLAAERGTATVRVDAVKVPHHGSRFNLSRDLLDVLDCDRYVFSTNGDQFGHPDRAAISRIVASRPERHLAFNYRTTFTSPWESPRLRRRFGYDLEFPPTDEGRLRVTV